MVPDAPGQTRTCTASPTPMASFASPLRVGNVQRVETPAGARHPKPDKDASRHAARAVSARSRPEAPPSGSGRGACSSIARSDRRRRGGCHRAPLARSWPGQLALSDGCAGRRVPSSSASEAGVPVARAKTVACYAVTSSRLGFSLPGTGQRSRRSDCKGAARIPLLSLSKLLEGRARRTNNRAANEVGR
jgi:hypothetical protein